MSELSKQVNNFFNTAPKSEFNKIKENMILKPDLLKILEMYYIDGYDINYIADTMHCSRGKIEADLRRIRKKLAPLI